MNFQLINNIQNNTFTLTDKELTVFCNDRESEKVFNKLKRIVLFIKKHYPNSLTDDNVNYFFALCRFLYNGISPIELMESIGDVDRDISNINWLYNSDSRRVFLHIEDMNVNHLYNALLKSSINSLQYEQLLFELYYRAAEGVNK